MKKAEINKEYKQTVQPMGVYCIKNNVNGKIYIGVTKNLQARINRHKFQLKYGSENVPCLQEDYRLAGEDNITFEVLDRLEPKEDMGYDYTSDLIVLHSLWVEKIQPFGDRGYNDPNEVIKFLV